MAQMPAHARAEAKAGKTQTSPKPPHGHTKHALIYVPVELKADLIAAWMRLPAGRGTFQEFIERALRRAASSI